MRVDCPCVSEGQHRGPRRRGRGCSDPWSVAPQQRHDVPAAIRRLPETGGRSRREPCSTLAAPRHRAMGQRPASQLSWRDARGSPRIDRAPPGATAIDYAEGWSPPRSTRCGDHNVYPVQRTFLGFFVEPTQSCSFKSLAERVSTPIPRQLVVGLQVESDLKTERRCVP